VEDVRGKVDICYAVPIQMAKNYKEQTAAARWRGYGVGSRVNPKSTNDENRRVVYQEIGKIYKGIDDFRLKLLGLLPLTTSGIFLLLQASSGLKGVSLPIGLFGFVATLGLSCYELRGMQYCIALIQAGKDIEDELHIEGSFKRRPPPVAGIIGAVTAATIIYPAVLAAWIYLAFFQQSQLWAAVAAVGIFISGIALFSLFDLRGHRALDCPYCSNKQLTASDDKHLSKEVQKHLKKEHPEQQRSVEAIVKNGSYQDWYGRLLWSERISQLRGLLNRKGAPK